MPTFKRVLTEDDVYEIVRLFHLGHGERSISRKIRQNEETVRSVLRGQGWRHITGGRLLRGRRPSKELARYHND